MNKDNEKKPKGKATGWNGRRYRIYNWAVTRIYDILLFFTHNTFPPFAAAAAVIEEEGKILLLARADGLGISLPGGLLQNMETLGEGLKREVKEETGYEVAIERLVGLYSGPHGDRRFGSVVAVYAAHITGGRILNSNEGQVIWTSLEELKEKVEPLAFNTRKILDDYVSGTFNNFY